MNNKLKTGYFYLEQANKFSIIRVPKDIITGEIFSPLSLQAKLLYGLLIDRMTLSNRNRWLDEENRVYALLANL